MRYLYTLCFYLILPFIFLRLLWRSRRAPGYRQGWAERLGFCPHQLQQSIWVHAVSVGETIAAIPLIKAIKIYYPNMPLIVTNMTPTGAARVKATFGDSILHAYVPYDLPDMVARFLKKIQPNIIVILETELWPNLFAACQKKQIPVFITNARLSKKSAAGYQHISGLTRQMLSAVHALASQGIVDAERFIALGLPKERVTITGNLKFDLELPQDLISKSEILRNQLGKNRFIWIAASTHPGEEEIVLAAHELILQKIPHALLILVPRHPERFDSVALLSPDLIRRSENKTCTENTKVYLGDTMGELLLMYAAADVAFVAGSFAAIGGHNMLEPAALGKAIITGPQLFHFAEISQMLFAAHGMIKVNNAEELADTVTQFFMDPEYCKLIGENAQKVVINNRGALIKQLKILQSLIPC